MVEDRGAGVLQSVGSTKEESDVTLVSEQQRQLTYPATSLSASQIAGTTEHQKQTKSKPQKYLIKKWAEDLIRNFPRRRSDGLLGT